ncbi:MAG: EpsG family protein [Lachnospiraceae bacterium]|nr:EpsG family protein [Lachnospiraceae bacterium]
MITRYLDVLEYDIKYIAVAALFVFIYHKFDKYNSKIQFIDILAILFLVCITGYRCNVGSDFYSYYRIYDFYSEYGLLAFKVAEEKLFYIMCYFISQISDNPFALFWAVAIILYPVLIILSRKITMRPSLVMGAYIFLGFFGMSHNILRQIIAMQFIILCYYGWHGKKRILSVLCGMIAIGFHTSAIVAIALIVIAEFIKPTFKSLLISVGTGGFILLFWKYIVLYILGNIPILNRYTGYVERSETLGDIVLRIGVWGYIIVFTILATVFVAKRNEIKEISHTAYKQITLIILGIPLSMVAVKIWVVNRIAVYLYQFAIFIIPILWNIKYKHNSKAVVRVSLVLLLVAWLGFINIFGCENRYYSYSFQWNETPASY